MSEQRARRVIGVDLGGTKTLGVLAAVEPVGTPEVIDRELRPSHAHSGQAVEGILEVVGSLLERSDEPVRSVGIGLAGFVDRAGTVHVAPNSPGVIGVDIGAAVRERFGLPVIIDNDANCAAVAAHRDAGPHCDDLVAVTLGTGIGGGIVLGGRLLRGANGFAGELGHMIVVADGLECPCGLRGCWERYASGNALGRMAREAAAAGDAPSVLEAAGSIEAITGMHVTELLAERAPDAVALFERWARFVALGVANVVVMLDPQVIVIGGGISAHRDLLGELVISWLDTSFPTVVKDRNLEIVITGAGPDTGALGAAVLASYIKG